MTGHPYNWVLLILLSVSGALVRHAMVTKNAVERFTLLPAAVGLAALIWMTRMDSPAVTDLASMPPVSTQEIHSIVRNRCVSCHSAQPTDDLFKIAPAGAVLETEGQILSYKDKIYNRVVVLKNMPFNNKTGVTEEERAKFGRWYQGLSN